MEKPANHTESITKLLTNQRFEYGYTELNEKLEQLKSDGMIDDKQFEKIKDEDILLKIKYRTYKKCIKQVIIGLLLIGTGCVVGIPLSYLFIVGGMILFISSFFGIISNRLTTNQIEYLKK